MSIGLKCDTLNVESLIIFVAISSMKMDVFLRLVIQLADSS